MAVPKKRTTSSSRDQRRSHIFLKVPSLTLCPKCRKPVRPHTVCLNCGFYKAVEKINVLAKLEKKEKKQREKEIEEAEKTKEEKPMSFEDLSRQKF